MEKLETGSFSISPELTRKGRGERVHAYRGRVRVTVELSDFTVLGELVTRLADLDLTSVDGPWWELRPASPAYAEARRLAVEEAVQRARAYAEALGTTLASLLELSDAGPDQLPMPRRAAFAGAAVAYSAEGSAMPRRWTSNRSGRRSRPRSSHGSRCGRPHSETDARGRESRSSEHPGAQIQDLSTTFHGKVVE